MAKRDEWVRVKSEDELRAGMAVQMRPCDACEKRETVILLAGSPAASRCCWRGALVPSVSRFSWAVGGHCRDCSVQLGHEIAAGELYRLADDQPTGLPVARELENVRANLLAAAVERHRRANLEGWQVPRG